MITGDGVGGTDRLKQFLMQQSQTKDLGKLQYFLSIEVARC